MKKLLMVGLFLALAGAARVTKGLAEYQLEIFLLNGKTIIGTAILDFNPDGMDQKKLDTEIDARKELDGGFMVKTKKILEGKEHEFSHRVAAHCGTIKIIKAIKIRDVYSTATEKCPCCFETPFVCPVCGGKKEIPLKIFDNLCPRCRGLGFINNPAGRPKKYDETDPDKTIMPIIICPDCQGKRLKLEK